MNKLITIKKKRDDHFELIEFDPRDPDNEDKWEFLQDFDKCGLLVDTSDDTMWTTLKSGRYTVAENHFRKMEAKFKERCPELGENLRLYNISTMPAKHIDMLLQNSGIAKKVLSKGSYPFIQANMYDDAVVIESKPLT